MDKGHCSEIPDCTTLIINLGYLWMFILCNVNTGIVSCDNVKRAIKTQLQGDIVAGKFGIGIVSGGNVISI